MTTSILDYIGNTPLIEIKKLNPYFPEIRIFAKIEGQNPGGSIKDRPALYMINDAEKKGILTKEKTIIEATSGNTGIALAMIAAIKGYKIKLFMPECVSLERRKILESYNAKLVLTPAKENTDGAIIRAKKLLNDYSDLYFMPDQFSNPANPQSHYETTGPEILNQMPCQINYFVCGVGSTGTLMGTGKFLKENIQNIKIVAIEPVKNHKIQGLKNLEEAIVPSIYDSSLFDMHFYVNDNESFELARKITREEGVFAGMSSGAALAGTLKLAEKIKSGNIVTIFPDRGDRYLSTNLFASFCANCPP
ncbi:MAG: cysteine synthase family protein [Bacteroidales bacterium]|jgi:cysteine synthase B|nr:cysteine synthase family protein [Bacteroidales bacterium]MDI9575593.1 cysteine synthase family protein [Bacteroidota bacterium]MDD3755870.1 cysteine synthase family protein [Bacteroidales bacterium]MDY0400938.1 cysteine synthase family protein [Bacteroidales bacterium]HHW59218.1 cysteine synthase family protein [Bacteroidales bacterium]